MRLEELRTHLLALTPAEKETINIFIAQSPTPSTSPSQTQTATTQQPFDPSLVAIYAAVIPAAIGAISLLINTVITQRSTRRPSEETEKGREHGLELQCLQAKYEQDLEIIKLSYEDKKKFISEWRENIANKDIRELINSLEFINLEPYLAQIAQEELRCLIDDFDRQWKQAQEEVKPRLETELTENDLHEMSRYCGLTPLTSASAKMVRQQYILESMKSEREKLGEPLRRLLYKQLNDLEVQWRLQ